MSKFVNRLARVLDLSKEDVQMRLDHLSMEHTMDVVSALNKQDKDTLLKMFKKENDKEQVSENVMGMASLSGLQRMAELAGIKANPGAEPVQINRIGTASCEQEQEQVGITCGPNGAENINSIETALGFLELNIPDMKISDLKDVRPRLEGLIKMLNESSVARKKRPL